MLTMSFFVAEAIDNGVISPKTLRSFARSKALGINCGRHTFILGRGWLKSMISELFSIVVDTSVDFSIDVNVTHVRFRRDCVC